MNWVKAMERRHRERFNEKARHFLETMEHGAGIDNIHMLGILRDLHYLYLEHAAHFMLVRSAEGKRL